MCMHDRRYRWVLVLTACVLIGMLIVSALSRPDLPETVPVTQAAKEDVYNTVSVKGTVRAKRESQEFIYAPARVETCYVSLGETVKAGQPLIQVYYPEVSEEVQQPLFSRRRLMRHPSRLHRTEPSCARRWTARSLSCPRREISYCPV